MKQYSMQGFDKEAFIEEYQYIYYLDNKENDVPEHDFISEVSVNSRIAEEEIERILSIGIKKPEDVFCLMAWKIGGIDHEESKASKEIKYTTGWESGSDITVKSGTYSFSCGRDNFNRFCTEIVRIASNNKKPFDDNSVKKVLREIINAAKETDVTYFGPVYYLTILYFVTQGQTPIFDRCAYKAVKAIYRGKKPKEIWYENPSNKSVLSVLKVLNDYTWYLDQVFGTSSISRDLDRALWVYGHDKVIK